MDGINFLKFMLLALALPTQYYLSQHWSNDNIQQSLALRNMIDSFYQFKANYLELESWKKWYISFVIDIPAAYKGSKVYFRKRTENNNKKINHDDDIALEVLSYRKSLTDFGESSVVRSPRPSRVKYRVGQVVKSKKHGFYGVVIGWDEQANAPSTWLYRNYKEDVREQVVTEPHYLILVDENYKKSYTSKAYISQDELEVVVDHPIKHRILNLFFQSFDGGQYIKKKFLETVYPHD